METAKSPPIRINYLKCTKQDMHQEENLNIVCLQKGCLDNLVGCCVCMENSHKKHKTKPLKMVIGQAKDLKEGVKPVSINIDIMLDILKKQQDRIFQVQIPQTKVYKTYKLQILDSLESTEKKLENYFNHISNQFLLNNTDAHLIIDQILKKAEEPKDYQELFLSVRKIVALQDKEQGKSLSEDELKESIQLSSQNLEQSIKGILDQTKGKIGILQDRLNSFMENSNLWQANYKFSEKFKHPDIKLLSENRVKAVNSQGYKFVIMEPEVEKGARKTFSFNIKQSKSNWLGIGFCDKNMVQSKGYSFKFNTIGHGAYIMSSNGGSWSNHKPEQNNTIKGIKFNKGDTIHASIDGQTSIIKFKKNNNNESYELPFQLAQKQELSPCVLFYYKQDEVEYTGCNIK